MKNLILRNGYKSIEICGTVHDKEVEFEIEDEMSDLYAYTWLNKQNLIDLRKHIDALIEQM